MQKETEEKREKKEGAGAGERGGEEKEKERNYLLLVELSKCTHSIRKGGKGRE